MRGHDHVGAAGYGCLVWNHLKCLKFLVGLIDTGESRVTVRARVAVPRKMFQRCDCSRTLQATKVCFAELRNDLRRIREGTHAYNGIPWIIIDIEHRRVIHVDTEGLQLRAVNLSHFRGIFRIRRSRQRHVAHACGCEIDSCYAAALLIDCDEIWDSSALLIGSLQVRDQAERLLRILNILGK